MRSPSDDPPQHKKRAAARFFDALAAPGYGLDARLFEAMGRRMVDLAAVQPGHHVLDVAAGRGALLFPTAVRAGPDGEVVGIDLAESMVSLTSAEIAARGLANARMLRMDAEDLEFPDARFDRVLCGFALFFFPHLDRALGEFRRVLRPGGRLLASTFERGGYPWTWYERMLEAYGLSSRDTELDGFVTDILDTPDHLAQVLERAEFTGVDVLREELVDPYPDADAWWDRTLSTPDGALLRKMDAEQQAAFRAEAFEHLQSMRGEGGLQAAYGLLIASAEREGA